MAHTHDAATLIESMMSTETAGGHKRQRCRSADAPPPRAHELRPRSRSQPQRRMGDRSEPHDGRPLLAPLNLT